MESFHRRRRQITDARRPRLGTRRDAARHERRRYAGHLRVQRFLERGRDLDQRREGKLPRAAQAGAPHHQHLLDGRGFRRPQSRRSRRLHRARHAQSRARAASHAARDAHRHARAHAPRRAVADRAQHALPESRRRHLRRDRAVRRVASQRMVVVPRVSRCGPGRLRRFARDDRPRLRLARCRHRGTTGTGRARARRKTGRPHSTLPAPERAEPGVSQSRRSHLRAGGRCVGLQRTRRVTRNGARGSRRRRRPRRRGEQSQRRGEFVSQRVQRAARGRALERPRAQHVRHRREDQTHRRPLRAVAGNDPWRPLPFQR